MRTAEEILATAKLEINHILDSGTNSIRMMEMVSGIAKRYANAKLDEAANAACDSIEAYPSEYEKIQQSILKLKDKL